MMLAFLFAAKTGGHAKAEIAGQKEDCSAGCYSTSELVFFSCAFSARGLGT